MNTLALALGGVTIVAGVGWLVAGFRAVRRYDSVAASEFVTGLTCVVLGAWAVTTVLTIGASS